LDRRIDAGLRDYRPADPARSGLLVGPDAEPSGPSSTVTATTCGRAAPAGIGRTKDAVPAASTVKTPALMGAAPGGINQS
jgi:hypothetical protein